MNTTYTVKITPQTAMYSVYILSTPTKHSIEIKPSVSTYADVVTDWVNRVVAAGGSVPSDSTQMILNDFVTGLNSASLYSKMKAVNCFVPDSIQACVTPLIVNYGSSSWYNSGLTDLSVHGLKGDGTNYLLTGIVPSTTFPNNNSAGVTLVVSEGVASDETYDFGCVESSGDALEFYVEYQDILYFSCWSHDPSGRVTFNLPSGTPGFFSGNRTNFNDMKVYHGTGSVLSLSGSSTTTYGNRPIYQAALYTITLDNAPTPPVSNKRFSFCAIHDGLIQSEVTTLFNLVKTMRTGLGGGSPG